MPEKYVHHNIVQKDNTTIMPENIYARRDWVHKDFPDRESTVHHKEAETLREKVVHIARQTECGVHMDEHGTRIR